MLPGQEIAFATVEDKKLTESKYPSSSGTAPADVISIVSTAIAEPAIKTRHKF